MLALSRANSFFSHHKSSSVLSRSTFQIFTANSKCENFTKIIKPEIKNQRQGVSGYEATSWKYPPGESTLVGHGPLFFVKWSGLNTWKSFRHMERGNKVAVALHTYTNPPTAHASSSSSKWITVHRLLALRVSPTRSSVLWN